MGLMDILKLFRQAANDRSRGATEIERDLLLSLSSTLRREESDRAILRRGAALLRAGQPCMANLRRLAVLLESRATDAELFFSLEERLGVLNRLGSLLGLHAAPVVLEAGSLITISRSSAVFAAITAAVHEGWHGCVTVLDGSPSGRGPEQAARIRKLGIEVRSLPDAAMLEAFDGSAVDIMILTGADAVGPRRLINSQGTQLLLEAAAARGMRRLFVADSGKDVPEEELDAIRTAMPVYEAEEDRRWPVFEALPLEYYEERIHENGRIRLNLD